MSNGSSDHAGYSGLAKRAGAPVLLAVVLAASLLPVAAGAKSGARVEKLSYSPGEGYVGVGRLGGLVAAVTFPPGPERFVSIEVRDDAGTPVMAKIVQDDNVAEFCGSTPDPIAIRPDFNVTVELFAGRCLDGNPSVVTGGVVEARFTSRPSFGAGPRENGVHYSITAPGPFVGLDPPLPGNVIVGYVVLPVLKERRVSLEIVDETGSAVHSQVLQGDREIARFCGRTEKPLRIVPSEKLLVYLHWGRCEDGAFSTPTQGVVKGVFYRGRR